MSEEDQKEETPIIYGPKDAVIVIRESGNIEACLPGEEDEFGNGTEAASLAALMLVLLADQPMLDKLFDQYFPSNEDLLS